MWRSWKRLESHVLITENNKIVTISAVNLHVCKKNSNFAPQNFYIDGVSEISEPPVEGGEE